MTLLDWDDSRMRFVWLLQRGVESVGDENLRKGETALGERPFETEEVVRLRSPPPPPRVASTPTWLNVSAMECIISEKMLFDPVYHQATALAATFAAFLSPNDGWKRENTTKEGVRGIKIHQHRKNVSVKASHRGYSH